MMKSVLISILSFILGSIHAQDVKPMIYLLPGQGADHRIFSKLDFGDYPIKHIVYEVPEKGSTMKEYALVLSEQIDQTKPFILLGTSLGGMLSCEMNEFMNPEKVIIISSAQNQFGLPGRYNMQKKFPIYKLVNGWMSKTGALLMQPIVEPDRNKEKEIFVSMLKAKDKKFLQRAIRMIMEWDKESYDESIIHIHGDNDKTLPIDNVDYNYLIPEGSHMITLTRPDELNEILKKELAIN